MKDRARVANLTDDHIIPHLGRGQCLHIRQAQGLALVQTSVGLRRLLAEASLSFLIHGMADPSAGKRAERTTNQRAFSRVSSAN
jgi:hypothetical protein